MALPALLRLVRLGSRVSPLEQPLAEEPQRAV
jgi:hypothetical protein